MKSRLLLATAFILSVAVSSSAFAQTYTIAYDQTRYNVDAGNTVDVTVLLREEISGAEVSRLAAGGNDGLFAFSLGLDYSMFTGGANGSTFSSLVLDPQFAEGSAGSGSDVTDDSANRVVSFEGTEDFAGNDVDGETGVGGTMVAANTWEVNLATLTFNAGDQGSLTTLQLRTHTNAGANPFLFGDGSTPDIGFTTAEIGVIPEPGTASLIALVAGIGLVRRRRN